MCAVICRKATFTINVSAVMLSDTNFLPSRCQSLPPEHKKWVFVLFLPSEPPFSGISSTKSGFLCAFSLRDPHFRAFRAQNQGFCALLAFGTPVYRLFKHKIGVFVPGSCCSGCGSVYLFAPRRAKSSFLKVAASVKSSACMPAAMAPSTLAGLSSVKRHSEALSPNFWQSRS